MKEHVMQLSDFPIDHILILRESGIDKLQFQCDVMEKFFDISKGAISPLHELAYRHSFFKKIDTFLSSPDPISVHTINTQIDKTEYIVTFKINGNGIVGIIQELPDPYFKYWKERNYYKSILQNTHTYVLRTDLQGYYTYVNSHYINTFKHIHEEFIGVNSLLTIAPENRKKGP
jgi:hypothetical protein